MKRFCQLLAALLILLTLLPAVCSCERKVRRLEEAPMYYSAEYVEADAIWSDFFAALPSEEFPDYTVEYDSNTLFRIFMNGGHFLYDGRCGAVVSYYLNPKVSNDRNRAIVLFDPRTQALSYTELRVRVPDSETGQTRLMESYLCTCIAVMEDGSFLCLQELFPYNAQGEIYYDTNERHRDQWPDNRMFLTRYDASGLLVECTLLYDIDPRIGGKEQKDIKSRDTLLVGDKLYLWGDTRNSRTAFLAEIDLTTHTLTGYAEMEQVFPDVASSKMIFYSVIADQSGRPCAIFQDRQTFKDEYCTADSILHPVPDEEPERIRLHHSHGGELIALSEDEAIFVTVFGVYRENIGGEEDGYESLFSWLDLNIAGSGNGVLPTTGFRAKDIHWTSRDRFEMFYIDRGTNRSYFINADRSDTPIEQTRPALLVAYDGDENDVRLSGTMRNFLTIAARFNRTSEQARIVLVPYTGDSVSTANEKLKMDIVSGLIPDMILFGGSITPEPFVRMGEFVDLYKFMDADDTYTRDAFLPCALTPFEDAKGQLPFLPVNVTFHTVMGLASATGGKTVWTPDDFEKAVQSLQKGQYLIKLNGSDNPQLALLETFLPAVINQYIDYDKKKTDFGGDFKRLLALCKDAPVLASDSYPEQSEYSDGNILLRGFDMDTPYEYMRERIAAFGDAEATLIGAPRSDGASVGTAIGLELSIAVMRGCPEQEAAWEFLKTYLDDGVMQWESYRSNPHLMQGSYGIMPTRAVAEVALDIARNGSEYKCRFQDETTAGGREGFRIFYDMNRILDQSIPAIKREREEDLADGYRFYSFSESDEAQFRQLFESCTAVWSRDDAVLDIIYEEASAYFAGARSLDDAVRLIENRVKTRINE